MQGLTCLQHLPYNTRFQLIHWIHTATVLVFLLLTFLGFPAGLLRYLIMEMLFSPETNCSVCLKSCVCTQILFFYKNLLYPSHGTTPRIEGKYCTVLSLEHVWLQIRILQNTEYLPSLLPRVNEFYNSWNERSITDKDRTQLQNAPPLFSPEWIHEPMANLCQFL